MICIYDWLSLCFICAFSELRTIKSMKPRARCLCLAYVT